MRGCDAAVSSRSKAIDGAGKSTHAPWLAEAHRARAAIASPRRASRAARRSARQLRDLLLHMPMTHDTEALLMFAARREHVEQVIRPALARGDWVVCDRFTDATLRVPGRRPRRAARAHRRARAVRARRSASPTSRSCSTCRSTCRARGWQRAQAAGRTLDKFEGEQQEFFARVRDAYLERAAAEPERFRVDRLVAAARRRARATCAMLATS